MNKASDFRNKEVINITDGKRLGFVCDVEINLHEGTIDYIIVPGPSSFLRFFGQNSDYVIPWDGIKKIGEDTILVEFDNKYLKK